MKQSRLYCISGWRKVQVDIRDSSVNILLVLHKFSDFPEPLNKKILLIETENFDMLNCTILLSGAVFVN